MANNNRAPEKPSDLIPEGRYRGKRIEHKFGFTGTDKEQIGVRFELTSGEYKGTPFTWYGFFTEAAVETTLKAMAAMGHTGFDPYVGWPAEDPEVDLVIEHELDQDGVEWRARVRWVNSGGVAMKETMNPAQAADFKKRFALMSKQFGGGTPAASRELPSRGRSEEPPPPSDDDAPPFQRNARGR